MEERYFFAIRNFVEMIFNDNHNDGIALDSDKAAKEFQSFLQRCYADDEEFCTLLICAGFIPDLYEADSSEETLFSKLVEVLVCEWAKRLGFYSAYVKEKGSYEDCIIIMNDKVVVCDAKSFRLGRSQKAPNVKDFLKLEDIRKWLSRHQNGLGGLVVYPDTHEWITASDAYQYCSTKNAPTLMLPFKYLALLLAFKKRYNTKNIDKLWDYDRIFPSALTKKRGASNKVAYWNAINKEIKTLLSITDEEFDNYIAYADKQIENCVVANLSYLEVCKSSIVDKIKEEILKINEAELRRRFIEYKIESETNTITEYIVRIHNFRLKNNG